MIIRANLKMINFLSTIKNDQIHDELNAVINSIISNVKLIKNCTIYDTDNITDEDVNLDTVLKYVGDLTGYEMGCNEFRFENTGDIPFLTVATYFLSQLKKKFAERIFVVYVLVENDVFFVRFHTFRKNEGIWLNENLEQYENAVMYAMN